MTPPLWMAILFIEFPVIMALLDCYNREPEVFPGGAEDRIAWLKWLGVAVIGIFFFLAGYGIVLGYYYIIVRRARPTP